METDILCNSRLRMALLKLQRQNADRFLTREFPLWDEKIVFGSGTRLYVTDNRVQKPKVTAYPASKPDANGKTTLLCVARDMFPDLVKISWKMKDENNQTEREELEQREEGQTTSMIIIDEAKADVNNYTCWVDHEACSNADTTTEVIESMCRLNLASLAYTVMIMKSLVYCCGFALLLQHRNMRSKLNTLTFIKNYWAQISE
ncbi:hypothetical protein UPYG_G00299430 [Umbra pygmaea]|uniref:Ig-like domain-containing protein n=1 Tax=Umbra pygmaea TaxID=75934 RepID=A0ABD0WVS7_UMBPY